MDKEDVEDLLKRIQPMKDVSSGNENDFIGKGPTAQKESKIKTVEMVFLIHQVNNNSNYLNQIFENSKN